MQGMAGQLVGYRISLSSSVSNRDSSDPENSCFGVLNNRSNSRHIKSTLKQSIHNLELISLNNNIFKTHFRCQESTHSDSQGFRM